ncbi:type II toxin-antitoxin system VapC family toxin [Candidatus Pacearchaeota archaeon]|nr:type II toxin-antitoxin system VapC family toxin [Candidatus Pacearchaeota archaeon]
MKYIDTNIFINAILYDDEKAERCKEILKKIIEEKIMGCTSFLSWDELVHIIKKNKDRNIAIIEGEKFLKFPNLSFIELNQSVANKAQEMISKYNLGPRDAFHIASALSKDVKEIISDDSDFDKVNEIKRIKV